MSERKIGVYLCSGCGIGEAVDMGQLTAAAEAQKPALCKTDGFLCGPAGVEQITADVASEGLSHVVVAACSPRVMGDRFAFDGALTVRANIREQVAWSHAAGDEDTVALACDNVRMALAEARNTVLPQPFTEGEFSRTVLVLGGGWSGLNAAKAAAGAGHPVIVVERSATLGGQAATWGKVSPSHPPYDQPEDNPIPALVAEVAGHAQITVKTTTVVSKTEGMPGQFTVTLEQAGSSETVTVGAIVVATGSRPYDPDKLSHLGYGASPDVLTNYQIEAMLANGGVKRRSDGAAPKNVAFIQCAGSRDPAHLPYCSSTCCAMSIKQALQLTEADPEVMAYIIYDELRTPGVAEEFYRTAQERGVVFVKGRVASVDGALTVTYHDDLLQQEVPLQGLDMVVLATGMVPNSTDPERPTPTLNDEQTVFLRSDINPQAAIDVAGYGEGVEAPTVVEPTPTAMPEGAPLLNLQYRQGPHLPMLADGFADSHYICFPYETRRSGIYTCGTVRRPMDLDEAADDGMGAALKAIQALRTVAEGRGLHPRSGDLSYPKINLNACTKCRRCTVECPFGAIDETAEDFPMVNPTRCRRCGTCMGACPVRTISFDNYSVEMLTSMAKAVEIPDEFSGKPRVLILACRNDAYPALDMAGIQRHTLNAHVRVIPVRCLGSVSLLCASDALSAGYDGIVLMGCKSGDDYQCHFVKGSAVAKERMSKISETLSSMMLEPERVTSMEVSIADSRKVGAMIDDFMGMIDQVGLNPFKGF